ncbi:MAG: alpha/beta fold hydrolase, partial [Bacteroidales bacterium]|nr:alpha/beta fold hydrolase [Bacteroidales bacterium]
MNGHLAFNRGKIHYSDTGTGPAIVLLHGFLESLEIWDDFTKELSKEFRIIAIDLPGFGKSSDVAEVHTMEMMAKAVYEVLSHLNTGQVVITGHSMGGYAALAFAASHPEKMKGLVIFHSHAAADSEEARINRDRAIRAV